jgi:hypothetical protein
MQTVAPSEDDWDAMLGSLGCAVGKKYIKNISLFSWLICLLLSPKCYFTSSFIFLQSSLFLSSDKMYLFFYCGEILQNFRIYIHVCVCVCVCVSSAETSTEVQRWEFVNGISFLVIVYCFGNLSRTQ